MGDMGHVHIHITDHGLTVTVWIDRMANTATIRAVAVVAAGWETERTWTVDLHDLRYDMGHVAGCDDAGDFKPVETVMECMTVVDWVRTM